MVEVLPQAARRDLLREAPVGRGDEPHVAPDLPLSPDPAERVAFEHPEELRLDLARELGDLVEEQGPARRELEEPVPRGAGVGEGPRLVPEELRVEEGGREARSVH